MIRTFYETYGSQTCLISMIRMILMQIIDSWICEISESYIVNLYQHFDSQHYLRTNRIIIHSSLLITHKESYTKNSLTEKAF